MWRCLKVNFCGILMLIGLFLVVAETMKFQYKISQREARKNSKLHIIANAMQTYSTNAVVMESLGRQLDLMTNDSDDYRYKFNDKK